jgi:hypothetical protein
MNDLKNIAIEMTSLMNIVEASDYIDPKDIDRISEIATILSALAPNLLDPRFK